MVTVSFFCFFFTFFSGFGDQEKKTHFFFPSSFFSTSKKKNAKGRARRHHDRAQRRGPLPAPRLRRCLGRADQPGGGGRRLEGARSGEDAGRGRGGAARRVLVARPEGDEGRRVRVVQLFLSPSPLARSLAFAPLSFICVLSLRSSFSSLSPSFVHPTKKNGKKKKKQVRQHDCGCGPAPDESESCRRSCCRRCGASVKFCTNAPPILCVIFFLLVCLHFENKTCE